MTFSNLRTMTAAALLGASLLSVSTASAQKPGVVRISDGVKQTSARMGEALPPAPLPAELTGDGVGTMYTSSGIQPIPEGTVIVNGHCQNCYHGNNCHHGQGHGFGCYLCCDGLPPDYGFYPPSPEPRIWRQPVVYQRYLPNQLYGTPGMRYTDAVQPMVYMPTDTTQLGFNYMLAPQWLPNRNNYPMAPNPVMWQRRVNPWPRWEDPYQAKHKHFHFGKNEQDLMPTGPMYLPYQKSDDDDDDDAIETIVPAPAPAAIEASLETDAQI